MIQTKDLINFLKTQTINTSFVNQLKIAYRPIICPFDELIELVQDEDNVFDIGCGSGQFCLLIAHFKNVKKIGGTDIKLGLIENARTLLSKYNTNGREISFDMYDGMTFPKSFKTYNTFFLIDVLHHVPKKHQIDFLRSIYNQMPSSSRLIIKDIDASNIFHYFNKVHDLVFSREIGNELSCNYVIEEATKIGFQIKDVAKKQLYVYPHFTLVAHKN
jgi:2-polyprenyl-3-methyl-5-hydroxy-6-metoxy-1,4-benzoquinol methylase